LATQIEKENKAVEDSIQQSRSQSSSG